MKTFLLPHSFKLLGWIFLISSIIVGVSSQLGWITTSGLMETVMTNYTVIGIAIGALFIIASKQKIEDEMSNVIRLSSLLAALYIYVAALIVGTLVINGINFILFLLLDSILFPVIFVIVFEVEMKRKYYCDNNAE